MRRLTILVRPGRALLAEFLTARHAQDYSWRRPNPRYAPLGLFLPVLEAAAPARVALRDPRTSASPQPRRRAPPRAGLRRGIHHAGPGRHQPHQLRGPSSTRGSAVGGRCPQDGQGRPQHPRVDLAGLEGKAAEPGGRVAVMPRLQGCGDREGDRVLPDRNRVELRRIVTRKAAIRMVYASSMPGVRRMVPLSAPATPARQRSPERGRNAHTPHARRLRGGSEPGSLEAFARDDEPASRGKTLT